MDNPTKQYTKAEKLGMQIKLPLQLSSSVLSVNFSENIVSKLEKWKQKYALISNRIKRNRGYFTSQFLLELAIMIDLQDPRA